MSYHGSPLDSIRGIIERKRNQYDRRKALSPKMRFKRRIRHPEAYAQAIEDAKRLNLSRKKKSIPWIRLTSRAKPTLAKLNLPPLLED